MFNIFVFSKINLIFFKDIKNKDKNKDSFLNEWFIIFVDKLYVKN